MSICCNKPSLFMLSFHAINVRWLLWCAITIRMCQFYRTTGKAKMDSNVWSVRWISCSCNNHPHMSIVSYYWQSEYLKFMFCRWLTSTFRTRISQKTITLISHINRYACWTVDITSSVVTYIFWSIYNVVVISKIIYKLMLSASSFTSKHFFVDLMKVLAA